MTQAITTSAGIYGEYQVMLLGADGQVKSDTGWFKNLLLDNFFEAIRTNSWSTSSMWFPTYTVQALRVGTGTMTPQATDTTLGTTLATVATPTVSITSGFTQAGEIVNVNTDPAWATWQSQFTFPLGTVVGNITEVGIHFGPSAGTTVHSRALIKDTGGAPTTLTVTAADQLIVKYRLTLNNINTGATGTINLGGTDYTWASNRHVGHENASGGWFQTLLGPSPGSIQTYYGQCELNSFGLPPTGQVRRESTGDMSLVTSSVAGERKYKLIYPINQGNDVAGIGAIAAPPATSNPSWGGKIIFTPPIPKTSTKVLTLEFTHKFTRV